MRRGFRLGDGSWSLVRIDASCMLVESPSISSASPSSSSRGGETSSARGPFGTEVGMAWVSMLREWTLGDGAAEDAMMRLREPELRLKTGVSASMVEEGEEEE